MIASGARRWMIASGARRWMIASGARRLMIASGAGRWMIASGDLIDGVPQQRHHHREPVAHSPGRARKVDHESVADDAGQTTRERSGRDTAADPIGTDRLSYPRDLTVQQGPGHLGGQVSRRQAGASGGQHCASSGSDRRSDRDPHRLTVTDHDRFINGPTIGD
jgi:hypothetical protein